MIDFETAIERVLGHEGGLVDHPNDPGMLTKYGISQRCLAPATRVLTANLHWVECGSLKEGDKLLAFDETPERHGKLNLRRIRVSDVLSVGPVRLPASRIETERREIIASDDHQWLVRRGVHRVFRWSMTRDILSPTGRYAHQSTEVRIGRFMEPWVRIESRTAGYLAGILDGEGHVGRSSIGFSQKPNACLAQAEDAMRDIGFAGERCNFRHGVWAVRFNNPDGRPHYPLEIAGRLGAARILERLSRQLIGRNLASTLGSHELVKSVTPIGDQDLIGLETSTHTLIAEGLLSHNSYPAINIRSLTREGAKTLYRRDFWDPVASKVKDPALTFQLMDAAVNHGMGNAIRMLQRAVGVADDGWWGALSNAAMARLSPADAHLLFLAERLDFWAKLSTFPAFGRGWMRRGAGNLRYVAADN